MSYDHGVEDTAYPVHNHEQGYKYVEYANLTNDSSAQTKILNKLLKSWNPKNFQKTKESKIHILW